ncbi:MAG TPA: NAD(P)-dependent alcohol dehydrogenase [Pseudolysinimonas sp.]|nr:NAD(P)-dependent alcohol dehydrogenase [Pseudolysinimonas sp.]
MRAIVHDIYGEADVLQERDMPRPVPRDSEVLIRVHAAGVDAGVWHLMTGTPLLIRPFLGFRGPRQKVRGIDVAGVIEQLGSGVTEFAVGDEVFGTCGSGSFAEYAVTTPRRLAHKPAGMSFEAAAAVPISGGTALQALRAARVVAGQQVLIIGASGGVGSFAVQLAVGMGATVTAVCRAAKADFVTGLGASRVLDYATQPLSAAVGPFEAIIDIAGNASLASLRRLLTPTGRVVIVGGEQGGAVLGGMERNLAAGVVSLFAKQSMQGLISRERGSDFVELAGLIEAGALTPAVDRTFPLAEAPDAVRALRSGSVRGKVVVAVF